MPADSVDNSLSGIWAGSVVPKRHARRAVTRNLIKRQIRCALQGYEQVLPAGLWLVRLRHAFARPGFVSACSEQLATAVRDELDAVLRAAAAAR